MSAMIGFVNTGQIERTTDRVTKCNSLLVIPFPKTIIIFPNSDFLSVLETELSTVTNKRTEGVGKRGKY